MNGKNVKTGKGRASPAPAKRVLIVDDHPMMRRALVETLSEQLRLTVCGEAEDEAEALQIAQREHPDLAIIDISLKSGSGIELIKRMTDTIPETRMLAFSLHDEALYAERALRAGAAGYVSKQAPPETLLLAIQRVLEGRKYVSPGVADRVLEQLGGGKRIEASPLDRLSDRELQTLQLIGQGKSSREIGAEMFISPKTVDVYRQRLKAKLKVRTNGQLVRLAVAYALDAD